MKKLINFSVMTVLLLAMVIPMVRAAEIKVDLCIVTKDEMDSHVLTSLRFLVEQVISDNGEGGCRVDNIPGVTVADAATGQIQNMISFETIEAAPTESTPVKHIVLNYKDDGENDNPKPILFKPLQHTLVGNPSDEAISAFDGSLYDYDHPNYYRENGRIYDAGFVIIDGKNFANNDDLPLKCGQNTTHNVYLRNMVIVSPFYGRTDFLGTGSNQNGQHADAQCFRDGGDLHFCKGELKTQDNGDFFDPNAAGVTEADWCIPADDCNLVPVYRDNDGDGHGTSSVGRGGFGGFGSGGTITVGGSSTSNTKEVCEGTDPGPGWSFSNDDCNDNDANNYPGNTEVCDEQDNNCNGQIDEGFPVNTFYRDADGDTFGDPNNSVNTCEPSKNGFVPDNTDCNDDPVSGGNINPAATEICNLIDDDCNGLVDDNPSDGTLWYPDADADTFGDMNSSGVLLCDDPLDGSVPDNTDCNDATDASYPGNPEICDLLDNDCNGIVDDNPTDGPCDGPVDDDLDKDGFCADPVSCVTTAQPGDCDDTDATIYPGAFDICGDGIDQDCSGADRVCDPEICDEPLDEDEDGDVNCDDDDCKTHSTCNPGSDPETECANGIDDDSDGAIDCDDADCVTDPACQGDKETQCDNGEDDDGDGAIDCNDADCISDPVCEDDKGDESLNCNDGIDNDDDGRIDCDDVDDCGDFVTGERDGQTFTCSNPDPQTIAPIGPFGEMAGGAFGGCSLTTQASGGSSAMAMVGFLSLVLLGFLRERRSRKQN